MCNCLQNLPCCHRMHHCHHQCNRPTPCNQGTTLLIAVYPIGRGFNRNYGPNTVSYEAQPTTVPYVYQYQNTTGATDVNTTAGFNSPYANLYLVNNLC